MTLHTVIGLLMKGEKTFSYSQSEPQAGVVKFVNAVEKLGEAVQAEVNLGRLRQRARYAQDEEAERRRELDPKTDLAEAGLSTRLCRQ